MEAKQASEGGAGIDPPSSVKKEKATLSEIITRGSIHPTSVVEEEHHSRLGEHAAVLWRLNQMTDVTVSLRGISYPAHRTVLSCYSTYFEQLLRQTAKPVQLIQLQLECVSNEAFAVLLRYMYTADLQLTCQNVGEVYSAARNLGVDGALALCVQLLSGKRCHGTHAAYVWVAARQLGLAGVAQRSLRALTRRFEHFVGTPEFLQLTSDQIVELLGQDELATRSEVVVFLAALKWLSSDFLQREGYVRLVLSCVRFPEMTLHEVLACHSPPLLPGLMELPAVKADLLRATCYVAARVVNEEKRFERFACAPRRYLLDREQVILWDPNIFDPDRHALYASEMAATSIQAAYRGLKARKELQAAGLPVKHVSAKESDEEEEESAEEDSAEKPRTTVTTLTDKMRKSIVGFFGVGEQEESVEKEADAPVQNLKTLGKDQAATSSPTELSTRAQEEKLYKPLAEEPRLDEELSKDEEPTLDEELSKDEDVRLNAKYDVRRDAKVIVVAGGFNADDVHNPESGKTMLQYDPANDTWSHLATMPKSRHHHRAVYLDGCLYFIGGCKPSDTKSSGEMVALRSCFRLQLQGRSWTKLPRMRDSRLYHACAVHGGKLYVVGGKDHKGRLLDSVEVFDPASDSWSQLGCSLPRALMGGALFHWRGRLALAGGMTSYTYGSPDVAPMADAYCYDEDAYEWKVNDLPSLPTPRAFASPAEVHGRVYLVGGTIAAEGGGGLRSTEEVIFCEERVVQSWQTTAPLPSPRHFVGTAVIGRSIFVVGGLTSERKSGLRDVLDLDVDAEGGWVPRAPLPLPLCGFATAPLPCT